MSSDHLLERFRRRGDEAAFRRLYRAHTPALLALALRLTAGDRQDSEDLVQEAWVRAVQRLDRFERRSTFRTWVCGILVNCYRELARFRQRGPRSIEDAGIRAAAERVVAADRPEPRVHRADVERALAHLPDGYREVLVLHDLNGYTHREIAALLAIEVGTSKSQLSRARQRLREWLEAPAAGSPRQEEEER